MSLLNPYLTSSSSWVHTENKLLQEEDYKLSSTKCPISLVEDYKYSSTKCPINLVQDVSLQTLRFLPEKMKFHEEIPKKRLKICAVLKERLSEQSEVYDLNDCYREASGTSDSFLACDSYDYPCFLQVQESICSAALSVPDVMPTAFGSSAFCSSINNTEPLDLCFLSASKRSNATLLRCKKSTTYKDVMPVYHIEKMQYNEREVHYFPELEKDHEFQFLGKVKRVMNAKMFLLNTISVSLMYSPSYKNAEDPYRSLLLKAAEDVSLIDPEFILKVALYARQELNVRSAANLLLAYSAYLKVTRPFLKKYFEMSIQLPSDWIEVAEIYVTFTDSSLKCGSLPAALRKAMKSSFSKFDEYQLAKYNKKKRNKQVKGPKSFEEYDSMSLRTFTLKQLIRYLHIESPIQSVMCLIGKRYPSDTESFRLSGLPGIWDSKKAGRRMKLPIPETWETMVSAGGNTSAVWEELIDKSKLPYMAMLRNLRNLLMCDISKKHHNLILKQITNKKAVIKSRQFPLGFYAAYKTLEELELLSHDQNIEHSLPLWKRKSKQVFAEKAAWLNQDVIKMYKNAVNQALEISALHNVDPIPGRTVIICDLINPRITLNEESTVANAKLYESCLLLSLLCLRSCEDCEMRVLLSSGLIDVIELENMSLLEHISVLCAKYEGDSEPVDAEDVLLNSLKKLLDTYLYPKAVQTKKVNNLILLLSSLNVNYDHVEEQLNAFLHKYRHIVNPELAFIQINVASPNLSHDHLHDSMRNRNIYLSGFTDNVLKFIAKNGKGGQLEYVENIDKKYNLPDVMVEATNSIDVKESKESLDYISPYSQAIKWVTARVFISSTFKDMHGERDLLIHYILPEIRSRASTMLVNINEIDLRWGISEKDTTSKRCAEFCIREAQTCDLFIGILGERYGTVYSFDPPDDLEFQWMKECTKELSITELEIEAGVLRRLEFMKGRAFFYIRSGDFIKSVPQKWYNHFAPDLESVLKQNNLKQRIRESGLPVYDGYPCFFGGAIDEKPFAAGLDALGRNVLNDLWTAIQENYSQLPQKDEVVDEYYSHSSHVERHSNVLGEKQPVFAWLMDVLENKDGIFVVTGTTGCGKSAFMAQVVQHLSSNWHIVLPFFVGATPRSTELVHMLNYIANNIARRYPSFSSMPKVKQEIISLFPDVLIEAARVVPDYLILVIDGLDKLDETAQLLDWLPLDFPSKVKIIVSTSESSKAYKALDKRVANGLPVRFSSLAPLNMADRILLVRNCLKQYGKVLDENSFNNQMLQLTTKMGSGNPLYLHLTCDYLRMFASFDNLMSTIQNLPSTINGLMEKILQQMEYQHDSNIIHAALCLLHYSKEGLEEHDFHFLLSIFKNFTKDTTKNISVLLEEIIVEIENFKPGQLIPSIDFLPFVHILCIFIFRCQRGSVMKLSSTEFSQLVSKPFMCKDFEEESRYFHCLLAGYYMHMCDPIGNKSWKGHISRAFRCLPFHLLWSECFSALSDIMCDLTFLEALFKIDAADDILDHYLSLLDLEKRSKAFNKSQEVNFSALQEFYYFISQNLHIFVRWPHFVQQQATNEPNDSYVYKNRKKQLVLESIMKSDKVNYRSMTIDLLKNASCLCSHVSKAFVGVGDKDGCLKLINSCNGKIISSAKKHAMEITAMCFIGDNYFCSASQDLLMFVWHLNDFSRVSVLKGHTNYISCCMGDLTGKCILSSSWDCSVRIWNISSGNEISALTDFSCPLSCIAHHPEQQIIACGLWNHKIEIWNTVSLEKKMVLCGHTGSVKYVVYSPDGLQLFSSSITAEVFIWSSDEGLKIGHINGHELPVACISFYWNKRFFVTASDDCTLTVWCDDQSYSACKITETKFCPINKMEITSPTDLTIAFMNEELQMFNLITGHICGTFNCAPDQIQCISKYAITKLKEQHSEAEIDSGLALCGSASAKLLAIDFTVSSCSTVWKFHSAFTSILHVGHYILCGTLNGDIALLKTDGLRRCCEEPIIHCNAHDGSITALSMVLSETQGIGLSSSTDMQLNIWKIDHKDSLSLSILRTCNAGHKDYVSACFLLPLFSSKNITYVTGSADNTVVLWKGEEQKILTGLHSRIIAVYYVENMIIGCSQDGAIAVWSSLGTLITKIPSISESSPVITFDVQIGTSSATEINAVLACVEHNGTVNIRKPFQRSVLCKLESHSKAVTYCCVTYDDSIISCSNDKTLNIWRIPPEVSSSIPYHHGSITSIISYPQDRLIVTADSHGYIVLWILSEKSGSALKYCMHKMYAGSVIQCLKLFRNNKCGAALNYYTKDTHDSYITTFEICKVPANCPDASEHNIILRETCSYPLDAEITCMDYCENTDITLVGTKGGNVILLHEGQKITVNIHWDWIVGIKVEPTSPTLWISLSKGECWKYSLNSKVITIDKLDGTVIKDRDSFNVWTTALCSVKDDVYIGDSDGWLRSPSGSTEKQVHTASVTGIYSWKSYLITSSLDRTLKIWDIGTLNQVGQFFCNAPISQVALYNPVEDNKSGIYLVIGSTVGDIDLLWWNSP